MSKIDRDLKDIIQILIRNNVPAIYPTEIAHLLHCKIEWVENMLFRMAEEELLEHRYELHCCQCGEIMSVLEAPLQLRNIASFSCPACYTQADSITMNELVSTFYPLKQVATL